jgi:hypothetical protein
MRARRRSGRGSGRRRLALVGFLVVGLIGALAACSVGGAGSSPSATTDLGSTSSAGSAPSGPTALQKFATDDLIAFDYPSGWHERAGGIVPSGNWPIVFVGPADLPSECTTNADGSGECRPWPVIHLLPGGIVVAWRFVGLPDDRPPTGGTPMLVAGLPAFRISGPADSSCLAIGGDESIDVAVPTIPGEYYWYAADACLAGPERSENEAAFAAILASATVPMPVSPSPSE